MDTMNLDHETPFMLDLLGSSSSCLANLAGSNSSCLIESLFLQIPWQKVR